MISATVVYACPHCGGEHSQKNGHTNHGAQRAKRVVCQRTFTLVPKGPRYDQTFKDQVLAAYQDRMSLRGIKRTFGVCHQTVISRLVRRAYSLSKHAENHLDAIHLFITIYNLASQQKTTIR